MQAVSVYTGQCPVDTVHCAASLHAMYIFVLRAVHYNYKEYDVDIEPKQNDQKPCPALAE